MVENGFSSPRSDAFPAGLRVLVVDDDPTWLKILEKMLKKCSYEVTTCGSAREALKLLRERKDGFDIVISDVYMPDMDGFKLLEHVGLEMDLPVIMMSVDGETSRVMKGVQHGACDYLLKPIRMKELRNIWQHVLRKKIHEVRDIEILEGIEGFQMTRNGSEHSCDGPLFGGEDLNSVKKRKDIENKHDDKDFGESSSTKKARVVWSVDLHQKFVKAVNQIGFDKVGPKKILDLMNVPWLSRENVASHLQKYRLYLSRLQKENDLKISSGGIKHSGSPSRDSGASLGIQNSIKLQHNDIPNGGYGFSGNNLLIPDVDPRSPESEEKAIVSKPAPEPKRTSTVDVPHPCKPRRSQIEFGPSFTPSEREVNFATFDSTFPSQYPWHAFPEIQPKQEHKPLCLDDGFRHLPLSSQQKHIHGDYSQPASFISSGPSLPERDVGCRVKTNPEYDEYGSNGNHISSSVSEVGSNLVETMAYAKNQAVDLTSTGTSSIATENYDLSCVTDLESAKKSINWGMPPFANLDDDWKICLVQGDCYSRNFGLQNIDFQGYCEPGLLADVPNDALRFDYENLYETPDYSLIDQSLFIA